MAILQSVELRESQDYYSPQTQSMWSANMVGSFYDVPTAAMSVPSYTKVAFHVHMRLVKDELVERHLRRTETEDYWIRSKIHNSFELEDTSGRTFPLDDIFVEGKLPSGTEHDRHMRYYPDQLLYDIQNRGYNLYVTMGDKRVKLINPLISNLVKEYNAYPMFRTDDEADRYRLNHHRHIDLKFEILCDSYVEVPIYNEATLKQVMQSIIKKNISVSIMPSRQEILTIQGSIAEMKARESLRDMLSEKEWRKYLTNGFVMVLGNSGKWYQVFNKQKHLRVYEKGKFIKELCIHTDASECPPTDHVLNMKIMIECDEQAVWDNSNLYEPKKKVDKFIEEENNNILDLFSKLKKDRQFLNNKLEKKRQRMEDEFFREYA